MTVLYTNPKGDGVTTSSYSSNELFKSCPRLYYLDKVQGWKRRDKSAALKFGRALESSIQFFHENGLRPDTGVDHFKFLWLSERDNKELRYTNKGVDWPSLYQAGAEMMKLYEVRLPSLPIKDPVFQVHYEKVVFPGSALAEIKDQGFVDLVSKADWRHPMLPKVEVPAGSPYRVLGIDIKTSGVSLDTTPDLLILDSQLLRYAWLSGILEWGFLWFVKSNPNSYEKGVEVTLLESSGKWTPGYKATIFKYDPEAKTALIGLLSDLQKLTEEQSEYKGKGSGELKTQLVERYIREEKLTLVASEKFTKQKLQFVAVRMNEEDVREAGQVVGKDIVGIIDANEKGFWPKQPGVRFPNMKCSFCAHRGICLKNNDLRDKLLVQISAPQPEDDWLDQLGDE